MSDFLENSNFEFHNSDDLKDKDNYPQPDLTYLKDMAENDEDFIREIILHFLENAPGLLNEMRQSAITGDTEKLRFNAHKLLPQLTFVGILAAIPVVSKIESETKHLVDPVGLVDKAIGIINYGIEDLKKMYR